MHLKNGNRKCHGYTCRSQRSLGRTRWVNNLQQMGRIEEQRSLSRGGRRSYPSNRLLRQHREEYHRRSADFHYGLRFYRFHPFGYRFSDEACSRTCRE